MIFDFYSRDNEVNQSDWKKLFANGAMNISTSDVPRHLEAHLKLLYTGITRCSERLFFFESRMLGNDFFRLLKSQQLAEPIPHEETSAVEGQNVEEAFMKIATALLTRQLDMLKE